MRKVVEAAGDLLGAAREFAARQCLQHQGRNEPVTKERDFFGFVVHRVVFLLDSQRKAKGVAVPCKWCVGRLKRALRRRGMRRGGRREPDHAASPAGGSARRRTGSGEQRSSRWIAAWRGRGGRSRAREWVGSMRRGRRTKLRRARGSGESRTGRAGRAWKAARRLSAFAPGAGER